MRPKISHVVVLELDVAKAFANSAIVNDALRVVLKAGQAAQRSASRSGRATRKRTTAQASKALDNALAFVAASFFCTGHLWANTLAKLGVPF